MNPNTVSTDMVETVYFSAIFYTKTM
jgi:hypothetical protein